MIGDKYKYLLKKNRNLRGASISGNIINALNKVRTPVKVAKHIGKTFLLYKDQKSLANALEYGLDSIDKLINYEYQKKVKSGEIKGGTLGLSFRPDFLGTNSFDTSRKMKKVGFKEHDSESEDEDYKPKMKHKSKKEKKEKGEKKERGDGLFFPGLSIGAQNGSGIKKSKKAKGFSDIEKSIVDLSDLLGGTKLKGRGLQIE